MVLLVVVFSGFVLGTAAIFGLLGGLVGSWICRVTGQERAVAANG
ncbi:hypothetical protein ACFQL4_01355 [Halosimplex aquaticum]